TSYVDADQRAYHSDAVFRVPVGGRVGYVHFLFEHQSSTDETMAFRILRYMVLIWNDHLREHPGATRFPAVFSLVIHHSRRSWSAPVDVFDLVDLDPEVKALSAKFLPRMAFVLDDLTATEIGELRSRDLDPVLLIAWL